MPEISIVALEGRTVDQKRALVKDITDAVIRHFKVKPDAVTVIIHEMSKENIAKSGKLFADQK